MSTAVQHLRFVYCQLKSPKSSPVSITRSLDFTIKCPSASYIQKRKEGIFESFNLSPGFFPFFKLSDTFHFFFFKALRFHVLNFRFAVCVWGIIRDLCQLFTLPSVDLPNNSNSISILIF
jgi:hypothetical protein